MTDSGKVCDKILWPKEVDTENLMSELELAIANGDHQRAAVLAKELAIKRAHCSLVGKLVYNNKDNISFNSPIVYVNFAMVFVLFLNYFTFAVPIFISRIETRTRDRYHFRSIHR